MPEIKYKQSNSQQMNLSATPTSIALSNVGGAVLFQNIGSQGAFVRFGATSPVNAAANDLWIPAASERIVQRDRANDLAVGGRTDAGQTTVVRVTEIDSIS